EQRERRAPEPRAEDVRRNEPAEWHPARASEERRDCAHQANEPAEEDRLATVTSEEHLDLLYTRLGDVDPRPVSQQEIPAQPPAELEAREVAGDGARPDDRDQRDDVDPALTGDDATDEDHGLARRDQADEGARLQEREHGDEEVGPTAERPPEVLEH